MSYPREAAGELRGEEQEVVPVLLPPGAEAEAPARQLLVLGEGSEDVGGGGGVCGQKLFLKFSSKCTYVRGIELPNSFSKKV